MPKPTSNRYVINATIIDGTIRLSGDIVDNVVEVPRREDADVVINDTAGYYLYASENGTDGGAAGCWGRSGSGAEQMFRRVSSDIYNIVYAVSQTNAANVVYGPIVIVKPKG